MKQEEVTSSPGTLLYKLAQLSDIHLPTTIRFSPRFLTNKRFTGYLNWQKRKGIHRRGVLDGVVSDMHGQAFDHLVITGDLTNLGLEQEYRAVRAWLEAQGPNDRLTVIPGNHDAYVEGAMKAGVSHLRPWLSDGPFDGPWQFPSIRFRGPLAIISLSSAISTGAFSAAGQVGIAQLSELGKMLGLLKDKGWIRVILLHHPPELKPKHASRRLIDARNFQETIEAHGAELVLSGHQHTFENHLLKGPGYLVPNLLVGAASLARQEGAKRAGYNLIEFWHEEDQLTIKVRSRAVIASRLDDFREAAFILPMPH